MRTTMGDTLKLLLLLSAVTLVASRLQRPIKKESCSEGQYNFKDVCFPCTPCGNFMYEQEKCSATSNTVCGWCGKKPNLNEISDEVLASYQTKCLMSSLDFIGMTKLKDELVNVYDKEPVLKVKIIKKESNPKNDHFEIAKDALSNFDDSEEQELPDPTLEEGNDSEEDFEALIDKHVFSKWAESKSRHRMNTDLIRVKVMEKLTNDDIYEDKTEEVLSKEDETEEVSESNSGEEQVIEYDRDTYDEIRTLQDERVKEIEEVVSDRVKSFLLRKAEENGQQLPEEWERNPFLSGATIVSLKEVEDKFNNFGPQIPVVRRRDFQPIEDSSSEESNERDIKWDNWVDDEVKPIEESVEIVEAEEISQKYEVYENIPRRLSEEAEQAMVNHFGKKDELRNKQVSLLHPVYITIMFAAVFIFFIVIFMRRMRPETVFTGVPPEDDGYQRIVEASERIEKMEKDRLWKEQKMASRHVHINPVFDV